MRRKWKVAVAVVAVVLAVGIGYGVRTLATQPLTSGIVLQAAWGNAPDQVGVKFFLADELNHRIQVYERGRWVMSIPLPPELTHAKEMCLGGDSLFLYALFEGGPFRRGLGRVDLKTRTFNTVDLEKLIPGFRSPYSLRAVPGGIMVRRAGPDLDPKNAPPVAALNTGGSVIGTSTEQAGAFGGDLVWWTHEPAQLTDQFAIYKRTSDGLESAPVDVPGTPGAMGIYIDWDATRVVVLTKPRELFDQKAYYINVYDTPKGSWQPHLVSVTAENEIPPSFSTGKMLQYVNGVLYEMAYTTDGVIVYQYVLP